MMHVRFRRDGANREMQHFNAGSAPLMPRKSPFASNPRSMRDMHYSCGILCFSTLC
jgi:hypothetical protein